MHLAPVITTKLHLPAAQADLVLRPALFGLLEQGLRVPLTLVSAPPGFGKSMLVAGWIAAQPAGLHTAWLSLDEGDNEPVSFWRYFIAALQSPGIPGLGETAGEMLSAPAAPGMQTILATLLNELAALASPFVFVLDDYHLIQTPTIHANLRFFLDHLPANVHLALLTREDPPLGLARRRARRQMVEIRAADLRFDTREAGEFLNGTRKLALTADQIGTLEQRTEGWVTGLQMAALSLQGRDPARFFETFTGDNRYVADYLIEEVLQRQPEPVREFLLKTAILERFSAGLCAALTGEASSARENLDTLERSNLFLIPLDNHREWYRYHHLFAELLRQRLRETHSVESIAGLHAAASAWLESQRDIPGAIRHARQIPDEPRARELLERYAGEFYERGALPQLLELAGMLSLPLRETAPVLCAAVAWAALASNHFEAVEDWLKPIEQHLGHVAEAAVEDASLDPARRAALLEVLVIRLQLPGAPQSAQRVSAIRDRLDTLPPGQPCLFNIVANLQAVIAYNLGLLAENDGETALAAAAFDDSLTLAHEQQNWHLYHLARGHLAGLQAAMGHLHAARQVYENALVENTGTNASPYLSLLHAGLGALHYEWNDLPAAESHFNAGRAYARLWNQWESLVPITLGLARLKQRAGQPLAALAFLDELGVPPLADLALNVEACTALLGVLGGSRTSPAAWLAAKTASAGLEPSPVNETSLLDVAHLMAALQQPAEADALLQKIVAFAESSGRTRTLVRARVARAKVLAALGNTPDALTCLLAALPAAGPEGYLSTFIDEGESMCRLLQEARGRLPAGAQRTYVEQVLAAFSPQQDVPAKRETGHGAPELSEREREILSLIAAGLSNQDIAGRLVISITTVKTHVGNIFNKLGVTSRTQAIARAEGLGLLPRR